MAAQTDVPLGGHLWVPGLDPATHKPAVASSSDGRRTWHTHVFTDGVPAVTDGGTVATMYLPTVAAGTDGTAYALIYRDAHPDIDRNVDIQRRLIIVSIYEIPIFALRGGSPVLADRKGSPTLIVNVASRCGLTPQYAGLEQLHERFVGQGFSVVGVPCNQFGGQEPGSAEEIVEFCSTTYGVTFPLTEKVEVNGAGRHPLYQALTGVADANGEAGDIRWNFEKFLVAGDGSVVARFRSGTQPDVPDLVSAVTALLESSNR